MTSPDLASGSADHALIADSPAGGATGNTSVPQPASGSSAPAQSSGASAGTNDHWPGHRRQLGERLFPRVHALRPVSFIFKPFHGINLFTKYNAI